MRSIRNSQIEKDDEEDARPYMSSTMIGFGFLLGIATSVQTGIGQWAIRFYVNHKYLYANAISQSLYFCAFSFGTYGGYNTWHRRCATQTTLISGFLGMIAGIAGIVTNYLAIRWFDDICEPCPDRDCIVANKCYNNYREAHVGLAISTGVGIPFAMLLIFYTFRVLKRNNGNEIGNAVVPMNHQHQQHMHMQQRQIPMNQQLSYGSYEDARFNQRNHAIMYNK